MVGTLSDSSLEKTAIRLSIANCFLIGDETAYPILIFSTGILSGALNHKWNVFIKPLPWSLQELCRREGRKTLSTRSSECVQEKSIFQTYHDWCTYELRNSDSKHKFRWVFWFLITFIFLGYDKISLLIPPFPSSKLPHPVYTSLLCLPK